MEIKIFDKDGAIIKNPQWKNHGGFARKEYHPFIVKYIVYKNKWINLEDKSKAKFSYEFINNNCKCYNIQLI
jgi:hypothetical protein